MAASAASEFWIGFEEASGASTLAGWVESITSGALEQPMSSEAMPKAGRKGRWRIMDIERENARPGGAVQVNRRTLRGWISRP